MKLYIACAAALLISSCFAFTANAQQYWDIDTISQLGAGGATPSGTWDVGTTPNWNSNSDGSGIPGVWSDFGDAVFSAGGDATGTYTVTLGGVVNANSIAFEEGNATITGGTELDLSGTLTIDVASGVSASIGSIVGGGGAIAKNSAGTLDLTNANIFSGFILNAGTVRVNNNTVLGNASSSVIVADGTTLATTTSTARTLTYGYIANGNFTLGQASGGTGAVTMAGTMDLNGGVRTITVKNGSDTISAAIGSSGGGITKEGTGTLTLSGANSYTGAVTVNAGILAVSNATGLGPTTSSNTTVNSGATLQVSGSITINEKINLNGTGSTGTNGSLRKTGNNTTAIQGQLTGAGDIQVTQGTLRLTASSGGGDNTGFTGPITVTGGSTLRFEFIAPNQLGTGNVITLDNGTLQNDNTASPGNGSMLPSSKTITLGAGGGTLNYNAAGAAGLSIINPTSIISGPGGLTKTGVGIVALAAPSTYGGPTHVVGGILRVRTTSNNFPTGTALTVDSGAVFDLNGLSQAVGSVTGAGNVNLGSGTFSCGSSNAPTTFSGQFVETNGGVAGKVTKQGTGTLTLTGANLNTGLVTVSAGTLLANNTTGSGTGSGPVTVASAGKLGGTGIISGAITNNGTIVPGDSSSIGTLTASSNVTDGANSHLAIALNGASTNMLAVGGNLDLSAADFLDVTGTGTGPWTIATYTGSLTGTFDTVTSGYSVNYGTGSNSQITLSAGTACAPGDLNCDGHVDAKDYVFWRKTNGPAGDYTAWRANFGSPPGAGSGGGLGAASAVPEPTALGLLTVSVLGLAVGRRGRREPSIAAKNT